MGLGLGLRLRLRERERRGERDGESDAKKDREKKEKENISDVVIARLEQIYPLPEAKIQELVAKYPKAELVWAQEEPENMGAWNFLLGRLYGKVNLKVVARKCSASTATGYKKVHGKEQEELLKKAFA